jgi:hypothetical protein
VDGLGDAQARRVADGQDHPVLAQLDGFEEPADLVAAQHDGQPLRLAAGGHDLLDAPAALEGDLVEEAQGGGRDQG